MPRSKAARLVAINRSHGAFRDAHTSRGELPEQIVRVSVAWPQATEVKCCARLTRERGKPTLRIVHAFANGSGGQPREHVPTRVAAPRHRLPNAGPGESVALDVVGLPRRDGLDKCGQIVTAHLIVARHHNECCARVRDRAERTRVARGDRSPNTAIVNVPNDFDAATEFARNLERAIATRVIHNNDAIDRRRHLREHAAQEPLLVVGRHDDDNRNAKQHARSSRSTQGASGNRLFAVKFTRENKAILAVGLVVVGILVVGSRLARKSFPPDTTPDGAYLRIALALSRNAPKDCFAYLERDAQWASYTTISARKETAALIARSYPELEKKAQLARYEADGKLPDGSDFFAKVAIERNWVGRLRKDLSGVDRVEVDGERATVITKRGTRYSFRRRDNGIWGLTIFTVDLLADAERATRDLTLVKQAAADYERVAPK